LLRVGQDVNVFATSVEDKAAHEGIKAMSRGPGVTSASCTAALALPLALVAVAAAREKGSEPLSVGMAFTLPQLLPHHSV
jgi:hypothetical protein